MNRRARSIPDLVAVLLMTAALLTACRAPQADPAPQPAPVASSTAASPSASGPFVRTDGRVFTLDGRPFRFVGANLYDAAATARYSCRSGPLSDADLLATLRALRDRAGVTVLRFWAYQTYTQGATDWSGVDRVIAAARSTGMRVIPVLEDGPGDCTTGPAGVPKARYDGDTWYTDGYRRPYGNATLSYRDYAARVVAHYADDPTVLGWSLMNEADTSARDALLRSALVDFATDMVAVVRDHDPNHLITVGTQSNGAPGASGADFSEVYSVPGVSFAEVHDWGYWGADDEAMDGGSGSVPPSPDAPQCAPRNAPIACSFARAARLGLPLVVGEAGIEGRTPAQRALRARQLRAKMDAAFAAGAAGYIVWHVSTAETDGYDLSPFGDDPLLEQLRQVSEGLR